MAITEVQLQNIRKLNTEDSELLLHECAENLGLITIFEMRTQAHTESEEIKVFYKYIKE